MKRSHPVLLNLLAVFILLMASCTEQITEKVMPSINWAERQSEVPDSLTEGETYLSVYSQIYSEKEKRTHDLTVTVSVRNTDSDQPLYLRKAVFYDSSGKVIKDYLKSPAIINPMETVEIIINERDQSGGTGGNFLFEWSIEKAAYQPLFEAIMISTVGQQGLSFKTTGVHLKK